jgi:hypothetical protein
MTWVVLSRCKSGLLGITFPPFNHFNLLIRAMMRSSVCHRLLRSRFLLDEFRVICKARLASLSSSNFTIVVYQNTWHAKYTHEYVFTGLAVDSVQPPNFSALASC